MTKIDMADHPHNGHRDRMRERILKDGLSALQPHEVLEYFLYAFVPRRDTNEIAHRLLSRFGSLSGVLDADYDDLLSVDGVTANAALFLSELPALATMYRVSKAKTTPEAITAERAVTLVNDLIGQRTTECAVALALDTKGKLLRTITFESNQSDAIGIDLRRLVKELLVLRAAAVIVAHNHPSGDVNPSAEDVRTYRAIEGTLQPLRIALLDCLIVGGGRAYSMAHSVAEGGTPSRLRFADDGDMPDVVLGQEVGAGEPVEQDYDLLFNRNKNNINH